MKSVEFNSLIKDVKPEDIREIIENHFQLEDRIHISKKRRSPIIKAPAIFKGAYNHFIRIKANINETYWETFTISYSELYTGETVIHELIDKLQLQELID